MDNPPFRFQPVLLEVAARAILRTHIDYQAYSLPRTWDGEELKELNAILCGPGIEVVQERTVTSAIALDFNRLRISAGWATGHDGDPRNYLIETEVNYEDLDESFKINRSGAKPSADLVAWTLTRDGRVVDKSRPPVVIEAKRARLFSVRPDGIDPGAPQASRASEDAEWLAKLVKAAGCRGWLLAWGVYERNLRVSATSFFEDVNKKVDKDEEKVVVEEMLCRWVPIAWQRSNGSNPPIVDKWVWVALGELRCSKDKVD